MTFTDVVALTSLALSCILLGWTIYRDLWDRGKLKVEIELVPDQKVSTFQIALLIINTGRRVVQAVGIMAEFKDGKTVPIKVPPLPMKLSEQEHVTALIADVRFLGTGVVAFYVFDPTGRKWRANKKSMQYWLRSYRRAIKGED